MTEINLFEQRRAEMASVLDDLVRDSTVQSLIVGVAAVRGIALINHSEINTIESMADAMRLSFNLRKSGGERTDREELPNRHIFTDAIDYVSQKVNLIGNTVPKTPKANAVLVLGGAARAPLDRAQYTKELIDTGKLVTDTVVLLGSSRPVDAREIERAGDFVEGAHDEYDLMVCAAKRVFGVSFSNDEEFVGYDGRIPSGFEKGWRVNHTKLPNLDSDIFVVSAPMITNDRFHKDGKRRPRANTADTFNLFQNMSGLKSGAKVVAVTNAHFRPFQGADAVNELTKYGIDAEVVGFDPSHFGLPEKEPEEKLQETLSAVNSMVRALA